MDRKSLIFVFILFLLLTLIYSKTFNYEFIWDSKVDVGENFLLNKDDTSLCSPFKYPWGANKKGYNRNLKYYRPVIVTSFLLEKKVWGISPDNHRKTNFFIYLLSIFFLYLFFCKIEEKKYFPEIAVTIFAFHPLNLDNIVWIVGRCDLFLIFFGILSLLFLELSIDKNKRVFLYFSSIFYLIGIFSKESFLLFFPVLLVYNLVRDKRVKGFYHIINFLITVFFFFIKSMVFKANNIKTSLLYLKSFTLNIKRVIEVIGYYFKSIIAPIHYKKFIIMKQDLDKTGYFITGILFILIMVFLFFLIFKNKKFITPLFLSTIFILGHVGFFLLTYKATINFSISSRYLVIPVIGFIWVGSYFLTELNIKSKVIIVFALMLLFIPGILINSQAYKNNTAFFRWMHSDLPDNNYVTVLYANSIINDKGYYYEGEKILNKVIKDKLKPKTAISAYILLTKIDFKRCDYKKTLYWIEKALKIPANDRLRMEVYRFMNYYFRAVNKKDSMIEVARKAIKELNSPDSYLLLYNSYVSFSMWGKALKIEEKISSLFPESLELDTLKTRREFEKSSDLEKAEFYMKYRNYVKALNLLNSIDKEKDMKLKLLMVELNYRSGKQKKVKKMIDSILKKNPDNIKVLNSFGNLYLKNLLRPNRALLFFNKSLKIDSNQPGVINILNYTKKIISDKNI